MTQTLEANPADVSSRIKSEATDIPESYTFFFSIFFHTPLDFFFYIVYTSLLTGLPAPPDSVAQGRRFL
jgi:hypothetical protein